MGQGHTVFEVLRTFEAVSGRTLRYRIAPRRPGDVAISYTSPVRAKELLGWAPRYNLRDICADAWNWLRLDAPAGK